MELALKLVAAFFLPPLAVGWQRGVDNGHFWLNLLLTLFGCWLPGAIHAFCVVLNDN